jgi:hypothetical protein
MSHSAVLPNPLSAIHWTFETMIPSGTWKVTDPVTVPPSATRIVPLSKLVYPAMASNVPGGAMRTRACPAKLLPHGQLVEVEDSYTLIPLDQPARLAQIIREFTGVGQHSGLRARSEETWLTPN